MRLFQSSVPSPQSNTLSDDGALSRARSHSMDLLRAPFPLVGALSPKAAHSLVAGKSSLWKKAVFFDSPTRHRWTPSPPPTRRTSRMIARVTKRASFLEKGGLTKERKMENSGDGHMWAEEGHLGGKGAPGQQFSMGISQKKTHFRHRVTGFRTHRAPRP
jgi:hypothetical protein